MRLPYKLRIVTRYIRKILYTNIYAYISKIPYSMAHTTSYLDDQG